MSQPRTSASLSATSSTAMGLRSIHAGLRLEDAPSRSSSRFGDSFLDTSWRTRRDSSYVSAMTGNQELNLRRQRRRWVEMRLFAYREDLADWFSNLFDMDISESSFISEIEDGILLCRLAMMIDSRASEGMEATRGYAVGHNRRRSTGHTKLRYNSKAAKGTFFARDNVSTFIAWARGLGIDDTVLFETSDLVELKNEKNVLYCLMEIARVQTALEPPSLIKLERCIDRNGYIAVDTEALEAAITAQCSRLNTPRSRVVRKGPALYAIDGREYYLALIRDRVLVRTGKHWDPLEHVLTQPVEQDGGSTSTPAATDAPNGTGRSASAGADTAASSPRRGPPSTSSSAFLQAPESTQSPATGVMSASGLGPVSPGSRDTSAFAQRSGSSDALRPSVLQESLHGPTLPAEDDRQELLDEIAELQQRVADLEADLTQAEGMCDSERRAHDDTRRRLADLEESMAGQPTQAAMEELEKANVLAADRLQECIEDMMRMRDDHLDSLEEKNRDIDERDRIIEELRAKGETFESAKHQVEPEEMEKLQADLSHAHRTAAEERERAAALREKADAHDDFKRKHEDAMRELQDALARVCELEDMIRSLQEADADRATSAAERVRELEGTLAAREAENKALQEEAETARQEAAAMKEKHEEQQEELHRLNDALAAAESGAAAAQGELEAARREQEDWQAEGGRMDEELREAKAAADTRAKEAEDLQRQLDEARKQNDDLHYEVAERDADIGKLKGDAKAAADKIEEQRAAAEALQQQADALKSKLEAKEGEVDRLRGDLDNTEREKGRAADDMTRALSECTEARSHLEERIAALEAEAGERDAEIAHLRGLLDEERAAAADLKQDNDDKAAEVSKLKENAADLESDLASLREEAAASAEATEQVNSTLQRAEADLAAKGEELQNANARLEELEALLASKDADAETGAKESKELQEQLHQLQIKYNLLQEGMLKAEKKCEEEKKHLREDRDRAIDDVVMLEDLNGRLMEEIQALEERCSALTQRLLQHEEELDALRGLAHESEDAIKALRQQKEQAEEEAAQNKEGFDAAQARLNEIEEAKRLEQEEQEEEERRRREEEEEEARAQAERDRIAQEEHERAMAMLEHDKELQKQNLELAPIRDDIADWINELLGTNMQGPALFHELQSGVVLCQLANIIDEHEEETRMQDEASDASGKAGSGTASRTQRKTGIPSSTSPSRMKPGHSPRAAAASSTKPRGGVSGSKAQSGKAPRVKPKPPHHPLNETYSCLPAAQEPIRRKRRRIPRYNYKPPEAQSVLAKYIKTRNIQYCPFEPKAKAGTGKARQNLGNFLAWTRSLGLDDPVVFREDDLLRMEDPRRVLWGLLDVSRCTRRMRVPRIVWLERLRYISPTKPVKDDSLDKAVQTVVNESINQPRLRVTRISEGKYTFGEEMTKPLLMRITKQNVLVRVGGGWQSLRKYLQTHFPTDPKMKADKDRFEPLWEENRNAPQQFDAKDGHKMNLHTTRDNLLFHS